MIIINTSSRNVPIMLIINNVMSEMKVGSIEVEQEIRLYRQTPQRGQQKELSTNHYKVGEEHNRQHGWQHGDNGATL